MKNIAKAGDALHLIDQLEDNSIDAVISRLPRPRRQDEVAGVDHPLLDENYVQFISGILYKAWYKLKEEGNMLLQVQESMSSVDLSNKLRKLMREIGWNEQNPFIWANDAHTLLQNNGVWRRYEQILWFRKVKNNTSYDLSKNPNLYTNLIETFTKPEDTVLDPFCVMGEVVLQAQKLGRHFVAFDRDEYAIMALKLKMRIVPPVQENLD